MPNYPKISIITPSFNQGQYIEETILSIINQKYPNLQFIIIDGGSDDITLDIIKKYETHIDYWVSEKDNGQSEAINKGLKVAEGELINWINSDDKLKENSLYKLAELYSSNPSCGVIIGQTDFFNRNGVIRQSGKIIFDSKEATIAYGQINQPATFYTKSAIRTIGPLNEQLHFCMDLDWWLKYLSNFEMSSIIQTTETLAEFRMHNESKTGKQQDCFFSEREQIYSSFLNQPKGEKINFSKVKNYRKLWLCDEYSIKNDKKNASKLILEVNPLLLSIKELRRYLGVIKNILFN